MVISDFGCSGGGNFGCCLSAPISNESFADDGQISAIWGERGNSIMARVKFEWVDVSGFVSGSQGRSGYVFNTLRKD